MRALPVMAAVAVMLTSSAAFGLEQSTHRAISRDACAGAGLPWSFCKRVGTEAYNVDSYEWDDMAAHAQVDAATGQPLCAAANLATHRVFGLGADLRIGLRAMADRQAWADGEYLATALGRALHTVQDNCAHRGISNPQHAWYSLSDTCGDTQLSPDLQPAALACARTETAEAIDGFVAALAAAGLAPDDLDDGVATGWAHYPARGDICAYLKSGNSWNGVDSHWENGVAVPALRQQFEAGVAGGPARADVCNGNPSALAPRGPVLAINTSRGQSFCFKIKAYCLGKADGAADEPPPWDDGADPAQADPGPPPTAGCSAGGGASTGATLGLVLGLALVVRSRRRTAQLGR